MTFNWLPPEIQERILLLALQLEPRAAQQITNLALTSRDCYTAVTRLVWKHTRVTRPSTLRLLHAALASNPALGELVQSIHIGPEDELDEQGWPLFATHDLEGDLSDWPIPLLATTLSGPELPRWVKPGTSFRLEQPKADCKNHHVTAAIQRAVEGLGVEPYRRSYDREGRRIGVRAWAARLWEAQAALDLYLMEMRHIEESRGYDIVPWSATEPSTPLQPFDELCRHGTCGHYPVLEVEQPGRPSRSSTRDRFVVTQSQIRSQLARRDGPTNHFEHLILFSRSTRAGLNMSEEGWASLKFDLGGPDDSVFTTPDFEYRLKKDRVFALSHGTSWQQREDEDEEGSQDEDDEYDAIEEDMEDSDDNDEDASTDDDQDTGQGPLDPTVIAIKTEDLLTMARQVLAATAQVTNLSLTGFFHPALDGLRAPKLLRSLSMGPLDRLWDSSLLPSLSRNRGSDGLATMPKLRKLRICGIITREDARKIARQLPSLRKFDWEMTRSPWYPDDAGRIVRCLQGRQDDEAAAKKAKQKRSTIVRLHPQVRHYVLKEAPSPEVGSAWKEGGAVQGTLHPVKVKRSRNAVPPAMQVAGRGEVMVDAQYAEGRKWWEEGRVGVGLHSGVG